MANPDCNTSQTPRPRRRSRRPAVARAAGAALATLAFATPMPAGALPSIKLPGITLASRDTRQAQAIERAVWARLLVRCGPNLLFAPRDGPPPLLFRKTRRVFESTTDSLSDATRLNGVEWQGYFYVNSALFRRAAPETGASAASPGPAWEPWQDNYTDSAQAGFKLRKLRGQWQISPDPGPDRAPDRAPDHTRDHYAPFDIANLQSRQVSCATPDTPVVGD